jgi:hypothetical protein
LVFTRLKKAKIDEAFFSPMKFREHINEQLRIVRFVNFCGSSIFLPFIPKGQKRIASCLVFLLNFCKPHREGGFRIFCGERGIRTPGTSQFNGFQDRRNRPLCHLSNIFCNQKERKKRTAVKPLKFSKALQK